MDDLIVFGNSMYPVIKDKDRVQVELYDSPKPLDAFEPGDVLFLRNQKEWHIHRLIKNEGRRMTKGDWAGSLDEPAEVWGIVTAVNRRKDPLLKNDLISRVSMGILQETPFFKRRLLRISLIFFVHLRRGLRFLP